MKNKFFLAIFTMMMAVALVLPAVSQSADRLTMNTSKLINFGTQVKLQCKVTTPVEFPTVIVTNNTNTTVPSGKKVYWQANQYMKGLIVLSAPLAPGKSVHTSTEAAGTSYNPVAWYFK